MNDQKRIKVTISPIGKPVIEAIGFAGVGCMEATKGIEQALGGNAPVTRDLKGEYHEQPTEATEKLHW